ncbi:hypothetical protein TH63_10850 [Rufibacter radiotolerans]|uniref:DUF5777 domain-containing protein n=2 Tax=Rufibacter radiotolerans TaxID=1379910 RepID=A0A0H4VQN1_9BACT|nr:hypothetical protein TH63_10850 [Rufibacter radiotolerans]
MVAFCTSHTAAAQEDLLKLAEAQDSTREGPMQATFKGTRLVNGHTVETNGAGALLFLISHRFGALNSGAYTFWGLDQATIRLGLEYGLNDRLTLGMGRSSLEKTYDGFLKYRVAYQKPAGLPVSVTAFASTALKSQNWLNAENNYDFAHRLTYTYQVLIARKFSDRLSLQVSPSMVHRNLVETPTGETNVLAVGAGGRFKVTKRTSFNAEYFYLLPGETADAFRNTLSLGVDIETGGHVFQLMATNAQGMIEKFFIPQNGGTWSNGDIYFGFNISRVFGVKEQKKW